MAEIMLCALYPMSHQITTAAGLRAGIPSIIVPFGGDQPFWGECVYKLGVGPKPILRKKLNVKRLSDSINEVFNNARMIEAAKLLGQRLRLEDGVENAVDIIEKSVLTDYKKGL